MGSRHRRPTDSQIAGIALTLPPNENIRARLANVLALAFGLKQQEARDFANRLTAQSYAAIEPVGTLEIYALASQTELECPDCHGTMHLEGSSTGLIYRCATPGCRGNHGAHPDGSPLGIPADARTRRARIEAHRALDSLWSTREERLMVYAWLARQLAIPVASCHISNFDAPTCRRVITLVERTDSAFILSSRLAR